MKPEENKTIYTIGHSTRNLDEFIYMLKSFKTTLLADIRSFPGSKKFPQFNKENLETILVEKEIKYTHIPELGGRRPAKKDSRNTRWKNDSFRGYADYMETPEFKKGIKNLISLAKVETVAFMCSEAVWWRCHRSMIADYLKAKGWDVQHIMAIGKTEEHPFTQPALVIGDTISYSNEDLVKLS